MSDKPHWVTTGQAWMKLSSGAVVGQPHSCSVVDAAMTLHCLAVGSLDVFGAGDYAPALLAWLKWRVNHAWTTRDEYAWFDDHVLGMACSAIEEFESSHIGRLCKEQEENK